MLEDPQEELGQRSSPQTASRRSYDTWPRALKTPEKWPPLGLGSGDGSNKVFEIRRAASGWPKCWWATQNALVGSLCRLLCRISDHPHVCSDLRMSSRWVHASHARDGERGLPSRKSFLAGLVALLAGGAILANPNVARAHETDDSPTVRRSVYEYFQLVRDHGTTHSDTRTSVPLSVPLYRA